MYKPVRKCHGSRGIALNCPVLGVAALGDGQRMSLRSRNFAGIGALLVGAGALVAGHGMARAGTRDVPQPMENVLDAAPRLDRLGAEGERPGEASLQPLLRLAARRAWQGQAQRPPTPPPPAQQRSKRIIKVIKARSIPSNSRRSRLSSRPTRRPSRLSSRQCGSSADPPRAPPGPRARTVAWRPAAAVASAADTRAATTPEHAAATAARSVAAAGARPVAARTGDGAPEGAQ